MLRHEATLGLVTGVARTLDAHFVSCQPIVALPAESVTTTKVFAACNALSAGSGFVVSSPGGDAIFRAGTSVALDNGFSVESGASFRVEIVPAQITP